MDISSLIGNTPLFETEYNGRTLFFKLEKYNLTGSAKDRPAYAMIADAVNRGLLKSGRITEPTSGNTGISLAAIGAAMGYEVIIVMPDNMSPERRQMIAAYGASLVLTPAAQGMSGAIAEAEKIIYEVGFMVL